MLARSRPQSPKHSSFFEDIGCLGVCALGTGKSTMWCHPPSLCYILMSAASKDSVAVFPGELKLSCKSIVLIYILIILYCLCWSLHRCFIHFFYTVLLYSPSLRPQFLLVRQNAFRQPLLCSLFHWRFVGQDNFFALSFRRCRANRTNSVCPPYPNHTYLQT
jgi:hypothetical protein